MDKLVVDSSAWIEYFKNVERGILIKKYLDTHEIATTALCVAEITAKFLREDLPVEAALDLIRARGTIISVDYALGEQAGKMYVELRKKKPKISLSDTITICTAKNNNAKVLAYDNDFTVIPEAIVLK
ncbi:MAG: PIN domain-containing protein [Candidatus Woesearchaeota archaeon]|jgi:predicted nucleic acid-binding protein